MLMRPCDASNHWPPLFNASNHGCALSNASNYWSVLSDASNHTANAFPASVQCTTVPLGSAFLVATFASQNVSVVDTMPVVLRFYCIIQKACMKVAGVSLHFKPEDCLLL